MYRDLLHKTQSYRFFLRHSLGSHVLDVLRNPVSIPLQCHQDREPPDMPPYWPERLNGVAGWHGRRQIMIWRARVPGALQCPSRHYRCSTGCLGTLQNICSSIPIPLPLVQLLRRSFRRQSFRGPLFVVLFLQKLPELFRDRY